MGAKTRLAVRTDEVTGKINPNIYGHFAEHLGKCIYGGIWVGERSKIPNVEGCRTDVVEALRRMGAPVIRWPGGCFADFYHWEDGIGPRRNRPRRVNMWWQQEEPNEFGTDEFLKLCSKVGAEPYICLNVGSGSPAEAASWLEYCNYGGNSYYSRLRARNGRRAPWKVRFWGVGNENWGCGGAFDPESYAHEYRRFSIYLKRLDPSIELVACGHISEDWNLRVMESLKGQIDLVDHLSIHKYFSGGSGIEFSNEDYLKLFLGVDDLEREIRRASEIVDFFAGGRKDIGIVVDEWGVWHPEARVENGLYQQNTLRDALFAASVLNLFNRYCRKVVMANIAQTVNVLQSIALTRGDETVLTPTYHVFDLYKAHMGNDALSFEIDSPEIYDGVRALDVSASLDCGSGELVISVVNRDPESDLELEIELRCGVRPVSCGVSVLTADDVRSYNDFGRAEAVKPSAGSVESLGEKSIYVAPPKSVSLLSFKLW